jgi:hypothetical protein
MKYLMLVGLLAGCSPALMERLSSEPYAGAGDAPTLTEVGLLSPTGPLGVEKRLYVNNPLPVDINARISCTSAYQADQQVTVRAHKSRYVMITVPRHTYGPSCHIAQWSFTP